MKSRTWGIIRVIVLLCLVLGTGSYALFGTQAGRAAAEQLGEGIVGLRGIQWLLRNTDVGEGAPSLGPEAAQWVETGKALGREERYEEAIEAFEQARDLAPDESEPYLGLASAYEGMEDWDQALAHLQEAQEVDPEDARVLRYLGRAQCLSGDIEACTQTLESAVEMDPDDAQNHYWLAIAYQQSAQDGYNRAIHQYQQALRLDPKLPSVYLAMGDLYLTQPGNEPLAVEAYTQAARIAQETGDEQQAARAHAALAKLYYVQDHYDQCVDRWSQVLEINPEDGEAHGRLALCYAMRREAGDLERAIDAFERSLALEFEYVTAYYFYLGQHYARQEDYVRAMLAWDQFLRFSDNEELNAEVREWMRAYQEALEEETGP